MISAWTHNGRLHASSRRSGDLVITDIGPAEYAAFVRDRDNYVDPRAIEILPDFKGWKKLLFSHWDQRRRALDNNPSVLFEADVNPVRRYLSDHDVQLETPTRVYLDIETDSRTRFSEATDPDGIGTMLLSFALVDEDGIKHTALLEDEDDQAEAELWAELWKLMSPYDQVAAWNGDGFDFIVKDLRCRYLARSYGNILAPYWENRKRLLFVDQMACFKRHHMAAESGDDKTSNRLNDVCEALLGQGKTDFDGSKTYQAWAAGGSERQRLVEYNLQDTALLPLLEKETGYLELQQTLGEISCTFVNSRGLKPSPQIDGYMLRMARKRETHLPSKLHGDGTHETFEGAFVQPPTSLGIHRHVHVCDFKSLYPTCVRTFNISPETKHTGIMRCEAFGTLVEFDTIYEGMVPAACREAMEGRDHFKREYKKDPNNKSAERKNKAFKIFCNTIYGWLGNEHGRFYDPELAESVTKVAKHLNNVTAEAARARGWTVIYMDTDSLFVTGCTVEEFKVFVEWCNTDLYPPLLDAAGVPPEQQCIALDYEKEFKLLVFPLGQDGQPAAKRYFASYEHYGFKPKDRPEIRGLEYMRSDGTRYARRLQKLVIDMILTGADAEDLHEWVRMERKKFFETEIDPADIAASSSISRDLDAYKVNAPHVRVARELEERGEDVTEGTRVSYIIVDGAVSPAKVIHISDYDGVFDRHTYWAKKIYPPVMRVLAGAFTNHNWRRWIPKRPRPALPGQTSLFT